MSVHFGMSEAAYHARAELSSTEARLLLDSPAKYRWRKDNPPLIDPSDKFDVGSAVHTKVLGKGAEVVVLDFPDYRTKAAREARDEARENGQTPILADKYAEIEAMAESVLAHPTARALFAQPGDTEVTVVSEVDGVPVRARFDFLPEQTDRRRICVDLKTTREASFREFERAIASYRYDVQERWYLDALNAETGPMPVGMEPEFVFVTVEKEPPHLVAVHAITPQWKQMGAEAAQQARRMHAACTETGVWPGYPEEIQYHAPPTWLVMQHEEEVYS